MVSHMNSKQEVKDYIEKSFYHRTLWERIRKKYLRRFLKYEINFGRGKIYQSFPMMNIEGQRPTDVRIDEYRIKEVLTKDMNVLDIGCNIGFFDMSIADCVRSVTGVEYNAKLVDIANNAANMLEIDNVSFEAGDFNEWYKRNDEKFDVVLSFAVHYWLKVTPQSYAEIIASLLKSNGYLFFESQNINTVDTEFDDFIIELKNKGLKECYEGIIKDDGIIQRRWIVLKKRETS